MEIGKRIKRLKSLLSISKKKKEIKDIEAKMLEPDFWKKEESRVLSQKLSSLKDEVQRFEDLLELYESAEADDDKEVLEDELSELERLSFLSGKYDEESAIINIFAGAGGDDAQDWAEMLLRMYLRYAEKKGFSAKVLDESRGSIAGIKSSTISISGRYAYGKLKHESGVHRLVRQSPFNAKSLRQTSFALVEVMPKIDSKEKDIQIPDSDLKVDTFRSSGPGGQSVNTTDSAVRIKHIPTGITVSCQNEKSQFQNKKIALDILKSKIAALLEKQEKEKIDELKGESQEPEWGSQIRSYVLHPYKLVKDHRTEAESKNPDEVLGGDLDKFIEKQLLWGAKRDE